MESGGPSPMPSSTPSGTGTPNDLPNAAPTNGTTTQDTNAASQVTKICVYCGSSAGNSPAHMEAARELAKVMAANNIHLVYGGGTVGLMGEVAKTLVSLSGPDAAHGIIPEALIKYERDSTYCSVNRDNTQVPEESVYGRTTVVKDMHTRKRMMAQEVFAGGPGSGFIALPGGYGTIEEVLETATWVQLGIHRNGICLLNVNGFYDSIIDWIRNASEQGFIASGNAQILASATNAQDAVEALEKYEVPSSTMKLQWNKT